MASRISVAALTRLLAAIAVPLTAMAVAPGLATATAGSVGASTESESAEDGPVTAELSYVKRSDGTFRKVRLKIARDGRTLLDEAIERPCSGCEVWPAGLGDSPSVVARDLDGDGEPEVQVDIYTGGAHCCTYAHVFRYRSDTDAYAMRRHNFRDPGYRLADLGDDGTVEFRSADGRFAYRFTSFAGSTFPLQIWRYQEGKLVDVTRAFPDLVRRDARTLLRLYHRGRKEAHPDVRGVLAAYVADQYLLGHGGVGWTVVRAALRRGELEPPDRFDPWPAGKRYLTVLRRFLKRTGYLG